MANMHEPENKTANKAKEVKETVAAKPGQVKNSTAVKKPAAAKVPAKKDAGKAAATTKPVQAKSGSAMKKPAVENTKIPVKKTLSKAVEGKVPAAKKTADKVLKTKSASAIKVEEVKGAASVAGQKISEGAEESGDKSENLVDVIASGLQGMKEDIHRFVEGLSKKTKDK